MGKATYSNRYRNINYVVHAIGELDVHTATEISKHVNLSRQAILDVLEHAKTWGYVKCEITPYRYRKDGTVLVSKKTWTVTDYGRKNAMWYVKAVEQAKSRGGQLPLL